VGNLPQQGTKGTGEGRKMGGELNETFGKGGSDRSGEEKQIRGPGQHIGIEKGPGQSGVSKSSKKNTGVTLGSLRKDKAQVGGLVKKLG